MSKKSEVSDFLMLTPQEINQLVKKYFTEASSEQVEMIMQELSREIEVMVHVKIRELVACERSKKIEQY
jgi:predicted XRE-type DNA-binding protein